MSGYTGKLRRGEIEQHSSVPTRRLPCGVHPWAPHSPCSSLGAESIATQPARKTPGLSSPGSGWPSPEPEFVTATATTNVWAPKAALPTARSFFGAGAGVVNGVLYAVGGNGTDGKKLVSVLAYTPGTNSWTSKAPLPVSPFLRERRRHNQRGALCGRWPEPGQRGQRDHRQPLRLLTHREHVGEEGPRCGRQPRAAPVGSLEGSCTCTAAAPQSILRHSSATIRRPTPGSCSRSRPPAHRLPAAGVIAGKLDVVGGLDKRGTVACRGGVRSRHECLEAAAPDAHRAVWQRRGR